MLTENVLTQYRIVIKEYYAAIRDNPDAPVPPSDDYRIMRTYIRLLLVSKPDLNHDDRPDTFPALLRWLERTPTFRSAKRDELALRRLRRYEDDITRRRLVGSTPLSIEELARL